jgi:hypothetical protein
MKRLYANILDHNELISKDNMRADIHSLLTKKPTVNNIITIVSLDGDTMCSSSMNCIYDLLYSGTTNENLFDSITKVEIVPAPEKRSGTIPQVTNFITMDRAYKKTDRHTVAVFPGTVMDVLSETNNVLYNSTRSDLSTKELANSVLDARRRQLAMNTQRTLKRAMAYELACNRTSIVLAIPATALVDLLEGSVPLSLCETNTTYATSITDLTDFSSSGYMKNRTITRQIFTSLIKDVIKNTFGLAKRGLSFVGHLIQTGDQALGNLSRSDQGQGYSETSQIHGNNGQVYPIKGVILTSSSIFNTFPQTQEGVRKGRVPMYMVNEAAYFQDNTNKTFIELNATDVASAPVGTMPQEVMDQTTFGQDKAGGFQELEELGKLLLNIEDEPAAAALRGTANQKKRWIMNMPVQTRCKFIVHQNAAVLLDNIQEFHTGLPAQHARADQTNSGMTIRNEMMRVSVGDYDYTQVNMIADSNNYDKNSDAASKQINVHKMVGQFPVHMHTPELGSAHHVFGKKELVRVFLDPLLHTAHDLARNYNEMFFSALSGKSAASHVYTDYFQGVSSILSRRNDLLREVVRDEAALARNKLTAVEVHPFYQMDINTNDGSNDLRSHKFEFTRRRLMGEIPSFVVPVEEHIRRGVLMANNLPSTPEMRQHALFFKFAHQKLIGDEGYTQNFDDIEKENIKGLVEILRDIIKLAFPGSAAAANGSNRVFNDSLGYLINFVIMPFLSAGISKPKEPYKILDDNNWDSEDVLLNEDKNTLAFFQKATTEGYVEIEETAREREATDKKLYPSTLTTLYSNAFLLARSVSHLSIYVRLCSLLSLLIRTTPHALKELVQASYPVGFTVDFMRLERMYAPDLIYTKPHAMTMIMSSKTKVPLSSSDNQLTYEMMGTVQTVSNMIGGTAVRVHGAIPNPRADDLACDVDPRVPRISADHLAVLGVDDVAHFVRNRELRVNSKTHEFVKNENTLTDEEKNSIVAAMKGCFHKPGGNGSVDDDGFTAAAAAAATHDSFSSSPANADQSYIAILRPVTRPSATHSPYLGIPRHEAVSLDDHYHVEGMRDNPHDQRGLKCFQNFYNSQLPTANPYISNYASLYNQRFTPTNMKTCRGIVPRTMNQKGYNHTHHGTLTSQAFQEALDLDAAHLATMTEPQMAAFRNLLARYEQGRGGGQINMSYPSALRPVQGVSDLLGPQHILVKLGMCLPLTQYTHEEELRRALNQNLPVFINPEYPAQQAILSPFHVDGN